MPKLLDLKKIANCRQNQPCVWKVRDDFLNGGTKHHRTNGYHVGSLLLSFTSLTKTFMFVA